MCSHYSTYSQHQIAYCYTGVFINAGATYPCRATRLRIIMDGTCEFYLSGNSCLLTPHSCLFSVGIHRSGHIDNALDGAQAADHIIQLMDARDVNHGVDNAVAVVEVACGNLVHINFTGRKR